MDCANPADNVVYTGFAKFSLFLDLYKQTINLYHSHAGITRTSKPSKQKEKCPQKQHVEHNEKFIKN